jgi:uncharacterized membrane protein YjgN (DUF898 family)
MHSQAALADDTTSYAEEPAHKATPETHQPTFSGSGQEYFRIWIVNLLLTIVTLGIYSAWAKVRRLQYFDRNTHLAGAVFDFTGNPMAILRGRILAVVLLGAYQYAFGFSLLVGIAVVLFLLAALPYLLRGALRFRLANTRYRGMRFGFNGSTEGAYYSYLPPMITVMLPTVVVALHSDPKMFLVIGLLYLLWPLMHGVIKSYQHQNLAFGNLESSYEVKARRFYGPYLLTMLIGFTSMVAVGVLAAILSKGSGGFDPKAAFSLSKILPFFLAGLVGYVMILLSSCYLQVRLGNMVWSNTSFPGIWIRSELTVWPYLKLQVTNTVLTILTLGLFRPFAVVRNYQFQLANMRLDTEDSFDHILANTAASNEGGADGVADILGVDLAL